MKIEKFKYFYPERPVLAHIDQIGQYDHGGNIAELKRNGSRLQLHYIPSSTGSGWQAWNRHEKRFDYKPNWATGRALQNMQKDLSGYCLFDGELRHNKTKGIQHQIEIYDIFIFNGKLLIGKPFWYRRGLLENIHGIHQQPIQIAEQFSEDFKYVYEYHTQNDPAGEIEGLVIKSKLGKLNLGRKRGLDSSWMWKVRQPSNSYRF